MVVHFVVVSLDIRPDDKGVHHSDHIYIINVNMSAPLFHDCPIFILNLKGQLSILLCPLDHEIQAR